MLVAAFRDGTQSGVRVASYATTADSEKLTGSRKIGCRPVWLFPVVNIETPLAKQDAGGNTRSLLLKQISWDSDNWCHR